MSSDRTGRLIGQHPDHTKSLRVAVIGAGMAGILAVIRLRESGITDVVCFEKADDLGGTWRENTYPGIACDVPSHVYSYSFAPNPDFSRMFSAGEEIQVYLHQVATDHGVLDLVRFGEEVLTMSYTDHAWSVVATSGDQGRFDVVIAATGVLHHPRLPDIDGLDAFEGKIFHSARWDHSVELTGRRVAVIGTGSTAVQITGAVIDDVARLSLFQRTPQWIMPLDNQPIGIEQRAAFRTDPRRLQELREFLERSFAENFADAVVDVDSEALAKIEQTCRTHLEQQVTDPELRVRLTPDYRAACKRLVVSADFYDAIQRPNAVLVTESIDRVEAGGIRTVDGTLHELDVIVLATGFHVDRFIRPIELLGPAGHSLEEAWASGPTAYLSVAIPGFPNLFLLNGPNGPVGNFSLIQVAELQMNYILQLIELLRDGTAVAVAARADAAAAFEAERVDAAQRTVWVTGCNSWYLDARGVPAAWPWKFQRFRDVMTAPDLSAFELHGGTA
jgi:cation diffusion facilitator CzcD-associated flavoprotein CzcO